MSGRDVTERDRHIELLRFNPIGAMPLEAGRGGIGIRGNGPGPGSGARSTKGATMTSATTEPASTTTALAHLRAGGGRADRGGAGRADPRSRHQDAAQRIPAHDAR